MIFNMSTGGASTADKVKYNNTESGLKSTDVQGAIDEVNSSLTTRYNTETGFLEVNIDGTWKETIYINPNEPIALIPVLTENTSNVSSSYNPGSGDDGTAPAYKAFDGDDTTAAKPYSSPISGTTLYVQYDFQKLVTIRKVYAKAWSGAGGSITTTKGSISILIGEDGITWESLWSSGTVDSFSVDKMIELDNAKKARYIRLKADVTTSWSFRVATLQAYGYK